MTAQSTSQSGTTLSSSKQSGTINQPVTAPIPVAGTQREHPEAQGYLRQLNIGDLELESGVTLPQVTIGYETWGTLNEAGDNAILILHALTGDTHVSRGVPTPDMPAPLIRAIESDGWWEGIVGPGSVVDTNRYFVIAPNILGGCYGSTGPASIVPEGYPGAGEHWGSRFPQVSIRDSVRAEARLARALGVNSFRYVIGGSLGGARALEWAATNPELVRGCAVIASGPSATAEQISWAHTQNIAIRSDANFAGGDYYAGPAPTAGLALARRIAHTTYRSPAELEHRFGREENRGESTVGGSLGEPRGRYAIESYLDHHGAKLVERFDANSYLAVNEALISHDVARGRGTLAQALAHTDCEWTIAAVNTDRLFFPHESHRLAEALPTPVPVDIIESNHGHDGFLIEAKQVEKILARALGVEDDSATPSEAQREREALDSMTRLYATATH